MVLASSPTVMGFSAWLRNVARTPAAASASGRMCPIPRPGLRLSIACAHGMRCGQLSATHARSTSCAVNRDWKP